MIISEIAKQQNSMANKGYLICEVILGRKTYDKLVDEISAYDAKFKFRVKEERQLNDVYIRGMRILIASLRDEYIQVRPTAETFGYKHENL